MSASLVGSEMCIRDSFRSPSPGTMPAGCSLRGARSRRSPPGDRRLRGAFRSGIDGDGSRFGWDGPG
eukprot:2644090-Alexandrium_andersonii.AAC.1